MKNSNNVVIYHYEREGNTFTTPSIQIANARKDTSILKMESIVDGVSEISQLEILSEDTPRKIDLS
jgi:hypothetical protein